MAHVAEFFVQADVKHEDEYCAVCEFVSGGVS